MFFSASGVQVAQGSLM